jgi:hypothetical protein
MAIHEIIPDQLYQGDILAMNESGFDVVITCSWLESLLPSWVPIHVSFPFSDTPELPDTNRLDKVAQFGMQCIGQPWKVLCVCNAGHNRSGLVCGRIMQMMGETDVVAKIKVANPEALSNVVFSEYLDDLEK